jgi:hypothetical protein
LLLAGVAADDAGAASGLVNVAHQLGGSLGLAVLVAVFTLAGKGGSLVHQIAAAFTAGAVMMAGALAIVIAFIIRPRKASLSPLPCGLDPVPAASLESDISFERDSKLETGNFKRHRCGQHFVPVNRLLRERARDRLLDFVLGTDAHHLQELPQAQIEGFFVHDRFSKIRSGFTVRDS